MQNLWILRLRWDEIVPDAIEKTWKTYYDSLIKINDLAIPRSIAPWNNSHRIILHGFSDAFKEAYGGCLYAVSTNYTGEAISTNLFKI